jgi:hypothetical protein
MLIDVTFSKRTVFFPASANPTKYGIYLRKIRYLRAPPIESYKSWGSPTSLTTATLPNPRPFFLSEFEYLKHTGYRGVVTSISMVHNPECYVSYSTNEVPGRSSSSLTVRRRVSAIVSVGGSCIHELNLFAHRIESMAPKPRGFILPI